MLVDIVTVQVFTDVPTRSRYREFGLFWSLVPAFKFNLALIVTGKIAFVAFLMQALAEVMKCDVRASVVLCSSMHVPSIHGSSQSSHECQLHSLSNASRRGPCQYSRCSAVFLDYLNTAD